jgi:hypothetical protein
MANSDRMPDGHEAPLSTPEQPTAESPSESIQPVPAGHPGIGLLITRARRRRSRATAELLAGIEMHRPSAPPQSPSDEEQRPES